MTDAWTFWSCGEGGRCRCRVRCCVTTATAHLPMSRGKRGWADIDNDGWLDLFVADEQGPSQMYHNRGDGTCENISLGAGIDRTQFSKGGGAADYDNDGYPVFFVSTT